MKYLILESQINKVIFKYFDTIFKDYPWEVFKDYSPGGEDWCGVQDKDGEMIIGHPSPDDGVIFFNGVIFLHMWDIFQIPVNEFKELMRIYVNDRYNKNFDRIY
jgi:hypothetical protein